MNTRALLTTKYWYEIAREHYLQQTLPRLGCAPLSWKLDQRLLKNSVLLWPSEYTWAPARKWMETIKQGFRRHLPLQESNDIPRAKGLHTIQLILRTDYRDLLFSIDYSDYQEIDHEAANRSVCYFKMLYRKSGYPLESVLPGGYVCNDEAAYRYITQLRKYTPDNRFALYGRFSKTFATELRSKAIDILQRQNQFAFEGSLALVRYSKFLEEAYHAKLCLDLPGNGNFCFRLIDYFALGAAVIAPTHENQLHVPLEPGKHLVYCREDLSDLVEVAAQTLQNPALLARLRENARIYFDQYLHQEQLTAYYLYQCFLRH